MMLTLAVTTLICTAAAAAAKPRVATVISESVVATWRCQDHLGVAHTPARSPWKPHTPGYWRAERNLWATRKAACLAVLHARAAMIRRLDRGLAGTPMSGTGEELERAGRRHGVHPALIAAIAGTESSFGAAACANNRFNAFGLSSCGAGWRVPYFRSWAEAYDFMGRFLTGKTSVTSGWPNARTPYDYRGYAACSDCWGRKTAYWMLARFGVGPEVRYP